MSHASTDPAAATMPVTAFCWRRLVLLLVAIGLTFGRAIFGKFVDWDDGILVGNNPMLWPESGVSIWQAWREPYAGLYTPLTFMWHAAVAGVSRLAGAPMHPAFFHASSIVLHMAGALLLWRWLRRLCDNGPAALGGTAIWMLHPLQAEPVAWVSGANGVLAGVLAIAALAAAGDGVRATGRRRLALLGGATLLFAASLTAKPAGLMLPAVLVVVHRLLLARLWTETLTLAGVWAAIAVPFVYIGADTQTAGMLEGQLPVMQRAAIVGNALGFYVNKTLWPFGLAADYGLPPHVVLAARLWIAPALLAALVCLTAILCIRRRPWVTAGIGVFVLGLLPVLGVVPFYYQSFSIVADRYAYFALTGVAIIVSFALRPLADGFTHYLVVTVMLILGAVTFRQVGYWHDTRSIFEHAMAVNPAGLAANFYAVNAARDAGDSAGEEMSLVRLLDHRPFDGALRVQYADLLRKLGRTGAAADQVRLVVKQQPRNADALGLLGMIMVEAGEPLAAREAFVAALSFDPNQPDATTGLAGLDAVPPGTSTRPVATQPAGR